MGHAYMALHDAGEHDAAVAGAGADFGPGLQNHRTGQPGQQFLGRLAHALAAGARADVPVDLLLLDEPTNHLDLDALGLAGSLAASATKAPWW
jgi:ATP-binding cassette subfamily F protein 3